MKKKLFVILTIIAGVFTVETSFAAVEKYECWSYKVNNGEVTITDCIDDTPGAMVIPDTIEGHPVTAIDSDAFFKCDRIKSLTIPGSITSIGSRAFSGCKKIESITIHEGVTDIGEAAFSGCDSLVEISIPNSVISMDGGVFAGCDMIKTITIPDGVQSIGKEMFKNCKRLEKVVLGKSCASVGEMCFDSCEALTSIEVDENNMHLSSLDGNLYSKDKTEFIQYALGKEDKTLIIPEGVTSVRSYSFWGNENIESVIFPKTIAYIGKKAFYGCNSLKIVSIACGNGTVIDEGAFRSCHYLKRVILGNGVASIGSGAFDFCSSIKSITIPDSVTSLGDHAFSSCENLKSVIIGDGITSIGADTFSQCIKLASITIPNSISFIGDYAFGSILGIDDVYYTGTEEQWKDIEIGVRNEELLESKIHYEYKPSAPVLEAECDAFGDSIGAYVSLGEDNSDVTIIGLFCNLNDKVLGVKTYCVTSEAQEAYLVATDLEEIKKVKIMIVDNVVTQNLINDTVTAEVTKEESDTDFRFVNGL